MVDHITGTQDKEHEVQRLFHFPIGAAKGENNIAQTAFADGKNLQIQVADGGKLEMGKGWIPTGGATAEEAPAATYTAKGALPMTLVTVLTPFGVASELPRVETIPDAANIAHIRVSFADGQRDEIAVAPQTTTLHIGAQQKTGRALIVREGPQAKATMILDGSVNGKAPMPATVTATSSQPDHAASNVTDKSEATFWVSGGTKPGEGPSSRNPEGLQFVFGEAQNVSALKILGRPGYGPKSGKIQASDDGKNFRTVQDFTLKGRRGNRRATRAHSGEILSRDVHQRLRSGQSHHAAQRAGQRSRALGARWQRGRFNQLNPVCKFFLSVNCSALSF